MDTVYGVLDSVGEAVAFLNVEAERGFFAEGFKGTSFDGGFGGDGNIGLGGGVLALAENFGVHPIGLEGLDI